jgi:serine/threonine-protein kinase
MGDVYRAHDTRLHRDVALKVLPDALATDSDRLARFEREAQVLAALNHPNIAAIYGLDESGTTKAIVLELVDGPTLADRIAQGPLQLDEARAIARQIAQALEAAHEQGIVHRDLKPANVKIRADGAVKVLDFGLAKALEPADAAADLTQSPTITSPALTQRGVLLGTATYMSPEVAKGRPASERSDIWAFGCVLYEMLSGKRAFDGDHITEVLGAVARLEPDWTALPANLPPGFVSLLKRCLQKDPAQRVRDIADARFQVDDAGADAPTPGHSARPAFTAGRAAGIAAVAGISAAIAYALSGHPASTGSRPGWRSSRLPPPTLFRWRSPPTDEASCSRRNSARRVSGFDHSLRRRREP